MLVFRVSKIYMRSGPVGRATARIELEGDTAER